MTTFDELMAQAQVEGGKVPTKEEVDAALKDTIHSFKTIKEINDFITKFSPDDCYVVIRDHVQPKSNMVIRRSKEQEAEEYQRFQDIQREAKETFDAMNKMAQIRDVHGIAGMIAQRYYGISLRMISKVDDGLGKVETAINRIEEHIGLDVTVFNEEVKVDDTAGIENEQGVKKTS